MTDKCCPKPNGNFENLIFIMLGFIEKCIYAVMPAQAQSNDDYKLCLIAILKNVPQFTGTEFFSS